jgi:hypothetical protein
MDSASSMTEWSGPFVLVVDFGVVDFGVVDFGVVDFGVVDCVIQEAWL